MLLSRIPASERGVLGGARILGRKTIERMTANALLPELLPYEIGGIYSPGYGYGLGMCVLMDVGQSQIPGSVLSKRDSW